MDIYGLKLSTEDLGLKKKSILIIIVFKNYVKNTQHSITVKDKIGMVLA